VSRESWRQTYVDNRVGEGREKGGSTCEVQHGGLAGRPDGRGE